MIGTFKVTSAEDSCECDKEEVNIFTKNPPLEDAEPSIDRNNITICQDPFILSHNNFHAGITESLLYKKAVDTIYKTINDNDIKFSQFFYLALDRISKDVLVREYLAKLGTPLCMSTEYILISLDDSYIYIFISNTKTIDSLSLYIFSNNIEKIYTIGDYVEKFFSDIKIDETKPKMHVEWYVNVDGKTRNFSISEYLDDIFYNECYPYLNVESLSKEYLDSFSPILLLFGPPGTGKTRLIRKILNTFYTRKGDSIYCIYTSSKDIIENGSIFLNLVFSDHDVLILEDIDYHLEPRKDGNTSMYSLLSLSNGILSNSMKKRKIILSTNLPNINNIDEALLRPGRCFDVVDMKKLTLEQADVVFNLLGKKRTTNKTSYTLADIYNS